MKTTVVPAQITTVEDKIAGSFTFIQIILLVFSLIFGTVLYAMIDPKLHLSSLKLVLIAIQFSFFGGLALRFKGRILADWLIIYLRYTLRPRIYIFTKNDLTAREIIQPEIENPVKHKVKSTAGIKANKNPANNEHLNLRGLIENSALTMSIKPSKKGGMDVVLREL